MKMERFSRIHQTIPTTVAAGLFVMQLVAALSFQENGLSAPVVSLWDAATSLGHKLDVNNRASWKAVPTDIVQLEADPAKASSDPGYYGREYSFQGDAVVENDRLTAAFLSAEGAVVIYVKPDGGDITKGAQSEGTERLKIAELKPLPAQGKSVIQRLEILRNAHDKVCVEATFSEGGSTTSSARFTFDKGPIIEVKPAEETKGFRIGSVIEYGIVPGYITDDLIYGAAEYPSVNTLFIPAENMFLGLLKGEDSMLVMTWPKASQAVKLGLANDPEGNRMIQSVDFENGGRSFYIAALAAPGIWHREQLSASYLEKDVVSSWKRPFSANWKTQLDESGVKTTYSFREGPGQVWRGVPGSYIYPVWFDGNQASYHLTKKVPPKGESLVYFLEGQNTPASILTPFDIVEASLGREESEAILDPTGRRLRTHHRRGGAGVHRACTCGCTEAIQAVFEAGEETERKEYIDGALDDMIYFIRQHVSRIDAYQQFAARVIQLLQTKGNSSSDLKDYAANLEQIAQQIPQEYNVQKENMKSLSYADELRAKTLALTGKKDPQNVAAYMELLKEWRDMGGAQDYVLAQCHVITRRLFQQAGYGCVDQPQAVELAEQIRADCRRMLRNPDGYEIWANY
jgi:hypothetical protein